MLTKRWNRVSKCYQRIISKLGHHSQPNSSFVSSSTSTSTLAAHNSVTTSTTKPMQSEPRRSIAYVLPPLDINRSYSSSRTAVCSFDCHDGSPVLPPVNISVINLNF
ncbi:hypothetical protein EV182_005718, partial [Spiromyces aspiralis]